MKRENSMFALIVTLKEVRADTGTILRRRGEQAWVCEDVPDHWVAATSWPVGNSDGVPSHIKRFKTAAAATAFAKRWKGHPWYVQPNGKYEVVEIKLVYKQVPAGYKRAVKAK